MKGRRDRDEESRSAQLERMEQRRQQELLERKRVEEEARFIRAEAQQQQAVRERRLQETANLKKMEAEVRDFM